jgi:hypothetical protein
MLYSASAFLLLLAPVATVVFDYRFLVPTFPLLGTAGAIGTAVLVDRLRPERGGAPEPPPGTEEAAEIELAAT